MGHGKGRERDTTLEGYKERIQKREVYGVKDVCGCAKEPEVGVFEAWEGKRGNLRGIQREDTE